ncbi:DNA-binding protein H-NS [Volucribacter psittacicida]|uniref:DNA-binding protein n=1 Tax=Volucribacter psittacicida TaxID=203482 RepID=A0A4R1G5I6_9PAST|nr:H-NS family nucleoid-associated regulatory protein [Volucribacter psittacicida]TCK01750.1 DNA-binding protein H-NS [Volucribacter psittacicida]
MSDLVKTLNNIRSLRALARELSLEELKSILEKLTLVVKEKHQEAAELQAKEQQRLEKLEKYKELLQQDGINAEDLIELLGGEAPKRKKREPKAAKYQYEENGVVKTWTGQGRMPKAIKQAVDAGKSLSSFEI